MDIDNVLIQCRFSRRYRGYHVLRDSIRLVMENESKLLRITHIYDQVAEKQNMSRESVERNLRTVISYSWAHGGKEQLELLSGGKLYDKPTSGEVIEMIAYYMKMNKN